MHRVDRDSGQHRVLLIDRDAADRPRRDVLGECGCSDAERGVHGRKDDRRGSETHGVLSRKNSRKRPSGAREPHK